MLIELRKLGLSAIKQEPIKVFYDQEIVGEYFADLLVENKIIIELKVVSKIHRKHDAQLLNYLKATKIEVGLLMNFGVKPSIRRKIFQNSLK